MTSAPVLKQAPVMYSSFKAGRDCTYDELMGGGTYVRVQSIFFEVSVVHMVTHYALGASPDLLLPSSSLPSIRRASVAPDGTL